MAKKPFALRLEQGDLSALSVYAEQHGMTLAKAGELALLAGLSRLVVHGESSEADDEAEQVQEVQA